LGKQRKVTRAASAEKRSERTTALRVRRFREQQRFAGLLAMLALRAALWAFNALRAFVWHAPE